MNTEQPAVGQTILYVKGMQCSACELLIEDELAEEPGVRSVKASLADRQVCLTGEFGPDLAGLADRLTARVKDKGYSIHTEAQSQAVWREFYWALPIAAVLVAGFIALQKIGFVNLLSGSGVNYGTALIVGLIASVSSCLAVVGGLTLSLAANYSYQGQRLKPHFLFHVGRLAAFFILGGLLGLIGQSFQLSFTASSYLSLIVAVVMMILGVNLLDLTHFTRRLQFKLPRFFDQKKLAQQAYGIWGPMLIGAVTFFLPCGFTQSMQVYTLTTGSFLVGGLTMLVFALGTLPVLALLSFSSFSLASKSWGGIFFKTAGLIVIALALFNLLNSLAVLGLIKPIFNF